MIKAQDLRIGNWLYDNEVGFKDHFKVKSGDIVDIETYGMQTYTPVQLTPEILEKMGFKKIQYLINKIAYEGYMNKYFIFHKAHNGNVLLDFNTRQAISAYCDVDKTQTHLKYVHQLQNLYFALTGNELEINL